jgi:hypothetical protein
MKIVNMEKRPYDEVIKGAVDHAMFPGRDSRELFRSKLVHELAGYLEDFEEGSKDHSVLRETQKHLLKHHWNNGKDVGNFNGEYERICDKILNFVRD